MNVRLNERVEINSFNSCRRIYLEI